MQRNAAGSLRVSLSFSFLSSSLMTGGLQGVDDSDSPAIANLLHCAIDCVEQPRYSTEMEGGSAWRSLG
jgi:hypothetical protein